MGLDLNTPLEKYSLKGRDVYVKRDDLHNGDLDLPPWAKIEGIRQLMTSEIIDKNKPLVHLAVRGSYTGWVLGHYGKEYGYDVCVVCPKMRGYNLKYEKLNGIKIYRHFIANEASGIIGFMFEYLSALWGETICVFKAWRNGRFDIIHLCNPPDILFLIALPYKWLFNVKIIIIYLNLKDWM